MPRFLRFFLVVAGNHEQVNYNSQPACLVHLVTFFSEFFVITWYIIGKSSFRKYKMDVLFPLCAGVREFSKLTDDAKNFIQWIEDETGVKVVLIGTGADIFDIIDLREIR